MIPSLPSLPGLTPLPGLPVASSSTGDIEANPLNFGALLGELTTLPSPAAPLCAVTEPAIDIQPGDAQPATAVPGPAIPGKTLPLTLPVMRELKPEPEEGPTPSVVDYSPPAPVPVVAVAVAPLRAAPRSARPVVSEADTASEPPEQNDMDETATALPDAMMVKVTNAPVAVAAMPGIPAQTVPDKSLQEPSCAPSPQPTAAPRALPAIVPQIAQTPPARRPAIPAQPTQPVPEPGQGPAPAATAPLRIALDQVPPIEVPTAQPPRPVMPILVPEKLRKVSELPDVLPLAPTVANLAPAPQAMPLPHTNVTPAPHAFAALIDRIAAARDAVQPQVVSVAVSHGDFGPVQMHFRHDEGALRVTLASPDPDFARAVAAAPPIVQPVPLADSSTAQSLNTGARGSDTASQHRHHPSRDPRDERRPRDNPPPHRRHQGKPDTGGIFA